MPRKRAHRVDLVVRQPSPIRAIAERLHARERALRETLRGDGCTCDEAGEIIWGRIFELVSIRTELLHMAETIEAGEA